MFNKQALFLTEAEYTKLLVLLKQGGDETTARTHLAATTTVALTQGDVADIVKAIDNGAARRFGNDPAHTVIIYGGSR